MTPVPMPLTLRPGVPSNDESRSREAVRSLWILATAFCALSTALTVGVSRASEARAADGQGITNHSAEHSERLMIHVCMKMDFSIARRFVERGIPGACPVSSGNPGCRSAQFCVLPEMQIV